MAVQIVVVGAGEVGGNIARSLAEDHDVVVVDRDPERVEALTYSADVLAVEGDGGNLEVLREADVDEADLLIASTDDDEVNIVTCGTAKTVGDPFTVARVKNTQYLDTWRAAAEHAFDVDFMVCTVLLAAQSIVRVIGLPAAQDVDTFADGLVRMAQFEIPVESPVAGQTVQEADRFPALTFVAIVREEGVVIPTGGTTIAAGDDLVVIGDPESVRQFGADISPEEGGPQDVVVVGGSAVGYHTARLLSERGFSPRLVERDPDRARDLAERLPDVTVMESDATDREFLERERIGDADVLVAALESDEQNLLASLLAKQLGTNRTVSVTEAGSYVALFEAVGVDVAINPREATAEEITRFTREQRAENVALIEGDRAEVIEIQIDVDSVLVDRPIRESIQDLPEGVVVGAITRDGTHVTPRGDTVVQVDDHVVVFVRGDVVAETTDLI